MDNQTVKVIAKLNKQLSKRSINGDLKTLDNKMHIRVLARLSKALASRELKRQLRELNNLNVNVGARVSVNNDTRRELQQNINRLQQSIQDLEIGLRPPAVSLDTAVAESSSQSLIGRLKEKLSSAGIANLAFGQVKEAVHTTLELEKAYTNLTKAQSQLSENDYSAYLSKCNEKAQELATTQKALIEGVTSFSKYGYNLSDSEALAEKSTVLSRVGDMDASDSVGAVAAGVQAYSMVDGYTDTEARAQALIDKYTEVGNTAGITTAEIARGVQTAGSAFADANTSVDEFIALLSAGNRQYQNADALASELAAAALRIHGCTAELAGMGEETDGVYTSAANLQERIEELTDVNGTGGVKILEADGETFRDIYDIFLDISKVYSQMPAADSSELLGLIAGKNNAPAIDATLNNMPQAQDILQTSLHAGGAAQEEYDSYLDSTQAHIQQFQAKLVEAYSTFANGDMISHAADLSAAVLDIATKTDLLKHSLIAITALKIGQGIAGIGGSITAAAAQMNTLGNAIQSVKTLPSGGESREDALENIGQTTKSLTDANLKLLLSQKQLSSQDKLNILRARDISEAEAQAKLERLGLTQATNANTASNAANVSSVNAMRGTFTGLKTSIQAAWAAMSALQKASIILAAVSTAWSVVSSVVSRHNQAEEEAVESAKEAANNYKESSSSIDDYAKRYAELRQALLAAKGDEEETYNVKKQLLELQTEMNEKYGDECDKLNLVTDAYKDQTDAIKRLNNEAANRFLNENEESINIARRNMESENTYDLSYAVAKTKDNEKILTDIVDKYKDSGMSIVDTGESFYIKLDADPKDAYETINAFQTDVRNAAKELGSEHLFDSTVLNVSSDSLNDAKDTLDKYQEIYDQSLMANIASDNSLSTGYNEAVSAVEAYNEAVLRSENPYNDENVEKAWNNLQTIKKGIQENKDEWGQYSDIMEDVFSASNDGTYSFSQKIQSSSSIAELAGNLNGMSDTDLQAMANDGDNGDAFDRLYAKAEAYGLEVQDLINLLIQLGYVQDGISAKENNALSFSEAWSALDNTEDGSPSSLKNELLSLAAAGQLTVEAFNSIEGSEDFLSQLGLKPENATAIEEITGSINELASSSDQLASMEKGMSGLSQNLYARQQESGTAISAGTFSGMDAGLKAQTTEWDNYVSVLGSASSSMEDVQAATDRLAAAYINSNNFLANLTESNKDYYTSQLQSMGVANAEEIVQQKLTDKYQIHDLSMKALALTKNDVNAATMQQVNALLYEAGASDTVRYAIAECIAQEQIFANNDLGTYDKAEQLKVLITQLYGAAAATAFLNKVRVQNGGAQNSHETISLGEAKKQVEEEFAPPVIAPTVTPPTLKKGTGSSGGPSPAKTETPEIFDFIETAISRVKSRIEEVKNAAKETFQSFKDRAKSYTDAISAIGEQISIQKQAETEYLNKANEVGLGLDYVQQIQNGSINIDKVTDDALKKRIHDYKEWYEKALACRKAVKDLEKEQKELAREQIELTVTKYDKRISRKDAKKDRVQTRIDYKEARGISATTKDYAGINKTSVSQIGNYRAMNAHLNKLKGTVSKGSEAWEEYQARIDANNKSVLELKTSLFETAKAAAALAGQKAERKAARKDTANELLDAKIENAKTAESKNALITDKVENIKTKKKYYQTAVNTDKKNVRTAGNQLKNFKKTPENKTILGKIKKHVKKKEKIPSSLLKDVSSLKNGGELLKRCAAYNAYRDALQSDKETANLFAQTSKTEIANLELEKFSNISQEWDNSLYSNTQKETSLNSQLERNEATGNKKDNAQVYRDLMSNEKNEQSKLINKRAALQKRLNLAVSSGRVTEGSSQWLQMVQEIDEVTNAIDNSTQSLLDYQKAYNSLQWGLFDDAMEELKRLNAEADYYIDMMANEELVDKENGGLTNYGAATLALHKKNYQSYLDQAAEYKKEYQKLMGQIQSKQLSAADPEVKARLQELQDAMRNANLMANKELQMGKEILQNIYDKQLEKVSSLISKYKDLMHTEKDAYEYQRTIEQKVKDLATLQKRLNAYSTNDDSEENRARIQQIKMDLADAKEDLKDTQYDKYLSDTENMLDEMYEDMESFFDEKLNDTEAILKEISNLLGTDSETIITTLKSVDSGLSATLEELLKEPEKHSENTAKIVTDATTEEKNSKKKDVVKRVQEIPVTTVRDIRVETPKDTRSQKSLQDALVRSPSSDAKKILTYDSSALIYGNYLSQIQALTNKITPQASSFQGTSGMQNISISLGGITMNEVNDPKTFAKQLREEVCKNGQTTKCITEAVISNAMGNGIGSAKFYQY